MVQVLNLHQLDLMNQKQGNNAPLWERPSRSAKDFPRRTTSVLRYQNGIVYADSCNVICEQEFRLFVNGEPLVSLLCSDAALKELAYGFLFTEQVINSLDEVSHCVVDEYNKEASFELLAPIERPECPTVSSGFGGKVLCSHEPLFQRRSIVPTDKERVHSNPPSKGNSSFVIADVLLAMDTMNAYAKEYAVTRGIHCSALFKDGIFLASYEDIGRHNTFDKLAGRCLLDQQETEGTLLTTTGRISGEMMRKAQKLGVTGVASFSGPTDAAVRIAQEAHTLLLGYVGGSSATIYAGVL